MSYSINNLINKTTKNFENMKISPIENTSKDDVEAENVQMSPIKKTSKNDIENIKANSKNVSSMINNDYIFNNKFILLEIEKNKNLKENNIIDKLKKFIPSVNNDIILQIYNTSISIHQSKMRSNGNFLEDILAEFLEKNNIHYRKQVSIDKSGIITGFDEKKKCYHIIDFVIGRDVETGKKITNYKIVSCKTTCRERWTQDDWTFTFKPNLYILLTISDDYPSSDRFREDNYRKIITCKPKENDDRKFKLNFENLINEL